MEISRQEFEDFSPKKVHEFVLEKSLLDEEEAVKLLNNKVDGYALLHSPVDEVRNVYGLLPGPAKSLVGKLAEMFPAATVGMASGGTSGMVGAAEARGEVAAANMPLERITVAAANMSLEGNRGSSFYLVKATIIDCKKSVGIRAAVHSMAQKHFGQYLKTKDETFYYDNDNLKIHVVFDTKDKARGFRNALSFWPMEQPLVMPRGKIVLDQDLQTVEAGNYSDILLSHYNAEDSDSPMVSLRDFKAAEASSTSSQLSYQDKDNLLEFQCLESVENFRVLRPFKMHLKSQAKFPRLKYNPNNVLCGGWEFHQLFDGLNLAEQDCPQVAVRICEETEVLRECVGEHREQRYKIGLILEFRTTIAQDLVKPKFKVGTTEAGNLMWRTFVHVQDQDIFAGCLQWKYAETKRKWSENSSASDDI